MEWVKTFELLEGGGMHFACVNNEFRRSRGWIVMSYFVSTQNPYAKAIFSGPRNMIAFGNIYRETLGALIQRQGHVKIQKKVAIFKPRREASEETK